MFFASILSFRKTRIALLKRITHYGIVLGEIEGRMPYEDIACRR